MWLVGLVGLSGLRGASVSTHRLVPMHSGILDTFCQSGKV